MAFLTVLTQVGGVVYVLALVAGRRLRRRYRVLIFGGGYLVVTLLIVPLLAPRFGRVALPWSGALRPLTVWTCLLNRHYVRPGLRDAAAAVTEEMRRDYPGTATHYLDANFPFVDGLPLLPHRSHSDGRKLDLAFYYTRGGVATDEAPGVIGYGASLAPAAGEADYAAICTERGYWQYALMSRWYEALPGDGCAAGGRGEDGGHGAGLAAGAAVAQALFRAAPEGTLGIGQGGGGEVSGVCGGAAR